MKRSVFTDNIQWRWKNFPKKSLTLVVPYFPLHVIICHVCLVSYLALFVILKPDLIKAFFFVSVCVCVFHRHHQCYLPQKQLNGNIFPGTSRRRPTKISTKTLHEFPIFIQPFSNQTWEKHFQFCFFLSGQVYECSSEKEGLNFQSTFSIIKYIWCLLFSILLLTRIK